MPRATMSRDDVTDQVVPVDDVAARLLALAAAPAIEPGRGGGAVAGGG